MTGRFLFLTAGVFASVALSAADADAIRCAAEQLRYFSAPAARRGLTDLKANPKYDYGKWAPKVEALIAAEGDVRAVLKAETAEIACREGVENIQREATVEPESKFSANCDTVGGVAVKPVEPLSVKLSEAFIETVFVYDEARRRYYQLAYIHAAKYFLIQQFLRYYEILRKLRGSFYLFSCAAEGPERNLSIRFYAALLR